ncbi:unnamed protein product [Paramecium sonneborni]|uniref:Uncharacterized protein n=1 Tax=Paramecium sonneborni TaxID=65129 RepID=A0A8S1LB25_9CILI|nr:unnamed protein product [Paramecium sonneborni]
MLKSQMYSYTNTQKYNSSIIMMSQFYGTSNRVLYLT